MHPAAAVLERLNPCVAPALQVLVDRLAALQPTMSPAMRQAHQNLRVVLLGSDEGVDVPHVLQQVAEMLIRQVVPVALRAIQVGDSGIAAALESAAQRCETEGTASAADAATSAAAAAATATYAATSAATNAIYAAAATYAATYAATATNAATNAATYAANAAGEEVLVAFTEAVVQILIAHDAPGAYWLNQPIAHPDSNLLETHR